MAVYKYDENDLKDEKLLNIRRTTLKNILLNSIELDSFITFDKSNKIESIKFEDFYLKVIVDTKNESDIKNVIDPIKTAIKTAITNLKRKENSSDVVSAYNIEDKLKVLIINTTIIKILTLLYAYLVFRQQLLGPGSPVLPGPPVPNPGPTPVPGKIDLNILLGLDNLKITEIYNPYLLNSTTDNESRSIFSTKIDTIGIEKGETITVTENVTGQWNIHLAKNVNNFKLLTALVAKVIKNAMDGIADDKKYIDISNTDTIIEALKTGNNMNITITIPNNDEDKIWNYSKTIVTNAIRINQREEARALNVYYYALDTIPLYMNIGLTEAQ